MTQEDKQLLLKDLSARLPYKPIVHAKWSYRETNGTIKHKETDRKLEINDFYAIWDVKPYLRPMSSMTEEEKKYIVDKCGFTTMGPIGGNFGLVMPVIAAERLIDFYNSHYIDYRGLIEKGLALEAPEGMYDIKS